MQKVVFLCVITYTKVAFMSSGFFLILGILAFGAIVATVLAKRKESKNYDSNGVPIGMEEQYQLALNPGADGQPLLYNLTTCNHCVRVHAFLEKNGIAHHDVTVDYFAGQARVEVLAKLRTYNPRASFPTLVFPSGQVVVGFRESALREAIGLEDKSDVTD